MTPAPAFRETFDLVPRIGGHRLRCVAEPARGDCRGYVMLLPPFAEEMNKSRRMCARLARALAIEGWRVVRVDLYGCGDSAGEWCDATWRGWLTDLEEELQALAGESAAGPLWLWGVRAGALFAPALLERAPSANLLLWQPVVSGAMHLQQFLRMSVAANLFGIAKADVPMRPAAQRLAEGETVEVAGYDLAPAVADGMKSATLVLPAAAGGRVAWLEVGAAPEEGCTPASVRAGEAMRAAGWTVTMQALAGAPYWQSTDIVENELLIARSIELVGAAKPESHAHAA